MKAKTNISPLLADTQSECEDYLVSVLHGKEYSPTRYQAPLQETTPLTSDLDASHGLGYLYLAYDCSAFQSEPKSTACDYWEGFIREYSGRLFRSAPSSLSDNQIALAMCARHLTPPIFVVYSCRITNCHASSHSQDRHRYSLQGAG